MRETLPLLLHLFISSSFFLSFLLTFFLLFFFFFVSVFFMIFFCDATKSAATEKVQPRAAAAGTQAVRVQAFVAGASAAGAQALQLQALVAAARRAQSRGRSQGVGPKIVGQQTATQANSLLGRRLDHRQRY